MNDDTIIIAGDRKQAVLLTLAAAVITYLIYCCIEEQIWRIVGVAFFGLGFVVCLYTILPGTVQLKIDRSGVEMKTLFKPVKLSWSDVDEFYIAYARTGLTSVKMIGIRYSESYSKQRAGRKIAAGLTGMEGALPNQFSRSAEEICDVLNSYKRKYDGSDDRERVTS